MTLQNHPGDREFPVRSSTRWARMMTASRQGTSAAANRALIVTGAALVVGIVVSAVSLAVGYPLTSTSDADIPALAILVLATFVGLVPIAIVLQRIDAGAPRRAQREYLIASSATPISTRQQQILALDATSDSSMGGWNSSLAYSPAWPELREDQRRRFDDGRKGSPWKGALPMPVLSQQRAGLDEQFRIASANDVELFVADVLAGKGRLSQRFAEIAESEQADQMLSRVAALAGENEFSVLERTQGHGGRPPLLLLAGDIERAIGAVRFAYVCGYLPSARAWELLERLGSAAFERFASYDDYWQETTVAVAFATDSLERVQSAAASRAALTESGWPAARLAWPAAPHA